MHELTHPVELRDEELDLVAAGSLIDVDVSKSLNNNLNNNNVLDHNNVAVGVGSIIGQKQ